MKFGSLFRQIVPHRAWPYPRGEHEIRQAIVVTLCVVIVTLIAIIAGLKYQDEKTLSSSDLYFAAKNMTSYSSEAYLIAAKSQDHPLVGPYRQVYIQQLASDVDNITNKLATHTIAPNIQSRAEQLQAMCERLHTLLNTFSRQSDDHTFAVHTAELHRLAAATKAIEASL